MKFSFQSKIVQKAQEAKEAGLEEFFKKGLQALIWTTTPWTILANQVRKITKLIWLFMAISFLKIGDCHPPGILLFHCQ